MNDSSLTKSGSDYHPGQVLNGYVLSDDGRWLPIAWTGVDRRDGYWDRFRRRFRWAALVAMVVLALMILPIPGLAAVNLGLWPRDWAMARSWLGDWSYWLEFAVVAVEALVVIAIPLALVAALFPSRRR